MPRHKEYDRQKVLNAATELFWERGYAGTPIRDLVEATGIHPRSMYEEFGDKEGLFLACLDHYAKKKGEEDLKLLRKEPVGLDNIEAFFQVRVAYVASDACRGCMNANTAIEKEVIGDVGIREVEQNFAFLEKEFYRCLKAAQAQGQIKKAKDCKVLASYLSCFLQGLMVRGKTKQSRKSVQAIVDTMLTTITNE